MWWPQSLDNKPPPATRGPSNVVQFGLQEDNDSGTRCGMSSLYGDDYLSMPGGAEIVVRRNSRDTVVPGSLAVEWLGIEST